MRNRAALFKLHRVAAVYGVRPSEVIGIDDEWAAYQLDAAAMLLGQRVQAAVQKGEDVDLLSETEPAGRGYRSPAGLVTKRVRIENGVW